MKSLFFVFILVMLVSCEGEVEQVSRSITSRSRLKNTSVNPIVIIKADDFIACDTQWTRFCNLIASKGIKASIGVETSFIRSNDNSIKFIQDWSSSSYIEFWNHSYEHYFMMLMDPLKDSQISKADYDGDDMDDLSIKTNIGKWLIDYSSNGYGWWDDKYYGYGEAYAHPVPSDYDGDGKADLSVKTDQGNWLIDYAHDGFGKWNAGYTGYGDTSAHPVPSDYDGDGKVDLSVKRNDGAWLIDFSNDDMGNVVTFWGYGGSDAHPVPSDYDGDEKADLSVKTDQGSWLIDYAHDGFGKWNAGYTGYGDASAYPVPDDYDGDGITDLSVKTDAGDWYIDYKSVGGLYGTGFGQWDCCYHGYGDAQSIPISGKFNNVTGADFSIVNLFDNPIDQSWQINFNKSNFQNGDVIKPIYWKTEFSMSGSFLQKYFLDKSQDSFNIGTNLVFNTFSTPFNGSDNDTKEVLKTRNEVKVWMKLGSSEGLSGDDYWEVVDENFEIGNIRDHIIMNISWIEGNTGVFTTQDKFDILSKIDCNENYVIIQIHPASFSEESWSNFVNLIDEIKTRNVSFMTPFQYYNSIKNN